jgi:quinol monooxygenase YgiN
MTDEVLPAEPKVLATFEIKMRPDANVEELTNLSESLHALARSTPTIGAIEATDWTREDGAVLVIYTFKSMAAMKEFVRHPDHVAIMKRAKEFFASVRTQIATIEKQSETILDA